MFDVSEIAEKRGRKMHRKGRKYLWFRKTGTQQSPSFTFYRRLTWLMVRVALSASNFRSRSHGFLPF